MNSVNLLGRCGASPEVRYTPSGKAVANLDVAVDDGFGEKKKTVWVKVTLWGTSAELASKALVKGDRVGISGRLSMEEWEDAKTGKKFSKLRVTGEQMQLIEPKKREDF